MYLKDFGGTFKLVSPINIYPILTIVLYYTRLNTIAVVTSAERTVV